MRFRSDRERAMIGIGFIGLLYDAHNAATDPVTGVTDTSKRRALAEPVLQKLYRMDRARTAEHRRRVADRQSHELHRSISVCRSRAFSRTALAPGQQLQRDRAPPPSRGARKLDFLWDRRWRGMERHCNQPHCQLPAAQDRALGLLARRPDSLAILAQPRRPAARTEVLGPHSTAARDSAAARRCASARSLR